MRLIDADALIEKRTHAKNYSPEMYVIGQGYVMDAPTIPSMEQGRWVWHSYEVAIKNELFQAAGVAPVIHATWNEREDDYADRNPVYYIWECSNCGFDAKREGPKWKYCPNCGARMTKGEL